MSEASSGPSGTCARSRRSGADGTPHVAPVGVTYDAATGIARVITSGTSQKVRNVRGNPRVAVCQVDGRRWTTLEGTAVIDADPGVVADAERRYAQRYRDPTAQPGAGRHPDHGDEGAGHRAARRAGRFAGWGFLTYIRVMRAHIGHDLLLLPGVGAIVVDDHGRLLFGRRSDTGRWAVVAGMVEPGEQPADTVVREVREETGVDVRRRAVLGVATHPVDYPNGDRCELPRA